ncbi:hypothetical protein CERZMDRAFT_115905 [Cercospora zeae-maydis SCOH1-5]|uniref:Uncharacterized protein n=1 Tax=Cercospora zeae-maydis SCOH1-5 TaxID=717836 RepID=A0A6A6EXM4_9PEZI|nr:hypothetical protein CERZMDRAFT_115905 [Cercospora zeae-maydis SCOH1-5]
MISTKHFGSFSRQKKVASGTRYFSKEITLLAKKGSKYDSTDPLLEDSAAHLARDFKNNPEGLEQHFNEKEDTINELMDTEVTGELEDIPQEELDS